MEKITGLKVTGHEIKDGWDVVSVESSTINKICHNRTDRSMLIEFVNGAQYFYEDVPRSDFEDFVESEHIGTYFAEEIRDEYETTKLSGDAEIGEIKEVEIGE